MLKEKQSCTFLDINAEEEESKNSNNNDEGNPSNSSNDNNSNPQQDRIQFHELFWKVWNNKGYRMPNDNNDSNSTDNDGNTSFHDLVFIFDLSSEKFKLVLARGKPKQSNSNSNTNTNNDNSNNTTTTTKSGIEDRLVFHGVRNRKTMQELDIAPYSTLFGWEMAEKIYDNNQGDHITGNHSFI